jgi:DNA-binding NtrC family response regulator/tetratricopeptide (TPR) repeat protein
MLEKIDKLIAMGLYKEALNNINRLYEREDEKYPEAKISEIERKRALCLYKLGYIKEALEILQMLLDKAKTPVECGKLLSAIARIEKDLGDLLLAEENCKKAFELLRNTNENKELGNVFHTWGLISFDLGNYRRALIYFEDSLSTFRRIGDKEGMLKSIHNIAKVRLILRDFKNAYSTWEEAIGLAKAMNKIDALCTIYLNIGLLNFLSGDWKKAEYNYSKCLQLLKNKVENKYLMCNNFLGFGIVELHKREFDEAEKFLLKALDLSSKHGYLRELGIAHEFLGLLEFKRGNYEKSEYHYNEALNIALKIAPEGDLMNQVERMRAELYVEMGDLEKAMDSIERARRVSKKLGDKLELGIIYRVLGAINEKKGELRRARLYYYKSIDILESIDEKYERAKSYLNLGKFLMGRRKGRKKAFEYLLRAEDLFRRVGSSYWVGRVQLLLARYKMLERDWVEAIRYIVEAEKVIKDSGDSRMLDEVVRLKREVENQMRMYAFSTVEGYSLLDKMKRDTSMSVEDVFIDLMRRVGIKRGFLAYKGLNDGVEVRGCLNMERDKAEEIFLGILRDRDGARLGDLMFSLENGTMVLPLRFRGDLVGVVYVEAGEDFFKPESLSLFTLGGDIISFKIAEEFRYHTEGMGYRREDMSKDGPVIITQSREMLRILDIVDMIKDEDVPILIEGETGTGKDLLAKYIHYKSRRSGGRFVSINCAALPRDLVESELFGYEKGAFTGAYVKREGKFKHADGGTIFLNEIGDMPLSVQAKLLRVLDSGEFEPLGSNETEKVDVRVIAASNRSLGEMVTVGKFREDLYHRLSTFTIHLPPLRERKEDIPLLVDYFISCYSEGVGKEVKGISSEALAVLCEYHWPGNVRELQNEIRRILALLRDGEYIEEEHISGVIRGVSSGFTLKERVDSYERYLLEQYIRLGSGRIEEVSRLAGIPRSSLYYLLKKHGLKIKKIS